MRKESICNEYYKIYFPYYQRIFIGTDLRRLQTLCISTRLIEIWQLAAYKEEDNTLCIGYAAGSMTGGGWEMLQTHIKSYGGDVMLEGTFVLLPYIKKGCTIFSAHSDFICIVFLLREIY